MSKNETPEEKKQKLYEAALDYHTRPNGPGKISITPTKELATARDLALAYSPGVAAPCEEIVKDPLKAMDYTARGNMVAVITDGTAVLGLGDIGPLAAKPVMEGKSVLFKKFAGIDAIDLEIDQKNIDKLVDTIAALEPSFGGVNLEDIKAPECFEVERRLKERMNIPVFHDDQHGTAIIVGAAFTNWIRWSERDISDIKLVASGAGASAIACLTLLNGLGLPLENIYVTDREGVVYKGRGTSMDPQKEKFAQVTDHRTLEDVIKDADVFLGLSGPGVLKSDMVASMADAPLIMALANPTPEIMPEEAKAAKSNAVICTGRSDYPNQVNNVLCFPFIFRGALDVGATCINEEMKQACVKALADLALQEATAEVAAVYGDDNLDFGPEYLIPKPFDPRLIIELSMAVAKAAMDSGVAARPIKDFNAYRTRLERYVFKSGQLMRPIYDRASKNPKRIVYAEGEEYKILRAVQTVVDDNIAKPILIGRETVILERIKRLGLRLQKDVDFELVNPDSDPRFNDYWTTYHELLARKGVSPATAKKEIRTSNTAIAAVMVHKNEADGMICGTFGRYRKHLKKIENVIGLHENAETLASMSVMILSRGTYFISDPYVNTNPDADQLAEMAILAAEEVHRFGIEPRVALLSHSDFGSHDGPEIDKMQEAARRIKDRAPALSFDGEMNADTALSQQIRDLVFPESTLKGEANLLIMPNIDAANIAHNLLKVLGDGIVVGPLLLGARKPAHILTPSVTARGIINATAVACVGAQFMDTESADKVKGLADEKRKTA
ncbi:MAG: NADP-dependent malic enzyme [Pseudomonadota bacterium]